jgi:hypothetical protein
MLRTLGATVDRRIANAIANTARRRWPPLRLVPVAWIRPLVKPAATHLRRELSRTAVTTMAIAGVPATVLLVLGGL